MKKIIASQYYNYDVIRNIYIYIYIYIYMVCSMPNQMGSGLLHVSNLLAILRIDRLT